MANKTGGMLSPNEISTFCTQIGMILKSGITVGEGLAIMREDVKNPDGNRLIGLIQDHVECGEPLHMALDASGAFPKYVVDMIEIGQQSGRLDEVMDSLVDYYEREENIAQSIKSAVTYPLIMIAMMVIVISVLVVEVLPIFAQVFAQLGSEMSAFSVGIMNFGQAVGRYSFLLVGAAAVLIVTYFVLRASPQGRTTLSRFKAKFFLTRRLAAKIASGRFASAMSMMLSSGLDTDQSLDMVSRLVDNAAISGKIAAAKELIGEGTSFSDALAKTEIFTGVYARMISVGFKTGSVDTVMRKLADRYEEEVDVQISSTISILEPTLVAVLSIVVGMILLSVMLPLMGIMSSIG